MENSKQILLLKELANKIKRNNMENYTFFWRNRNPFSQWYGDWMDTENEKFDGSFYEGKIYYRTTEHYMMMEKARLFNDSTSYNKIKVLKHPRDVKKLGRLVSNYNQDIWDKHKEDIVFNGNYAKFTYNLEFKELLLNTDDSIIVEASPKDFIWGIGLTEEQAKLMDPSEWPGENLLGKVLTNVRNNIKEQIHEKNRPKNDDEIWESINNISKQITSLEFKREWLTKSLSDYNKEQDSYDSK